MSLSNPLPSPVKDGRRILSEKSANACLSPTKRSLVDSSVSPGKKLLPSPSFVAQKRSISQVDDENAGGNGILRVQHVGSRPETRTPVSHEVEAEAGAAAAVAAAVHEKRSDAMEAKHPQPQPQTLRPYTLTHTESTTNQNTQIENQLQRESTTTHIIPEDPETRKLFIQEKASLLRNRIQNAMRHVRDPQFDRRVSELEAHSRKYPRLSGGSFSTSSYTPSLERRPEGRGVNVDEHENDIDNEEEVAAEDEDIIILTPRAIPPRPLRDELEEERGEEEEEEKEEKDDPLRTPTQKSHRHGHRHRRTGTGTAGSPMQLSSPPVTVIGGCDDDCLERGVGEDESGVVVRPLQPSQRGDAVDGLLKLMNTAEKSDGWST